MKGQVARRARIARVRRIEHLHAAAEAAAAEAQVVSLEASSERLAALRGGLIGEIGASTGARIAHTHELAMRLDVARAGLTDAIAGARITAASRAEARIEARRNQDSAEKLEARAAADLARLAERRANAIGRRRRGLLEDFE
ncbi:MAG: hypothetical protein JOY99_18170 [Sphingomonadaceae bacterium]|nr:hypothetical protein [Sphingomonadaceae bacterium]